MPLTDFSYSIYECLYDKIKASQRMTVPMDDDVELWDVVIKNTMISQET